VTNDNPLRPPDGPGGWRPDDLPEGRVYCIPPIDFWGGWMNVSDVVEAIGLAPESQDPDQPGYDSQAFGREVERLYRLARVDVWQAGWEEMERPWRCAPLPAWATDSDVSFTAVLAVKERNNGATWIWSPIDLPWLAEYVVSERRDGFPPWPHVDDAGTQ
jgi:hypothetical protein